MLANELICKAMTKSLYGNSEKSFLECEKMGSRNIFRHFFRGHFFMFVLLIGNRTVFQNAEMSLAEAARATLVF